MWEEKLHFLERLAEQHPEILVISSVLFGGFFLIAVPVAIYQTIRDLRKSSETIRQAPGQQAKIESELHGDMQRLAEMTSPSTK